MDWTISITRYPEGKHYKSNRRQTPLRKFASCPVNEISVRGLISEDVFEAKYLHLAEGSEVFGVEVLDVSEYGVAVAAVLDPLLLGGAHVLEAQALNLGEILLCGRLGKSETAAALVASDDVHSGGPGCPHPADKGILGNLECGFRLRHVVDDLVEGLDCLAHLVVLGGDESKVLVVVTIE